MLIDLFAGSFECAVTKDATVELNNFDRAVTMRTAYKNIEHIYLLSKKTNKRGGFGNRSRTLAKLRQKNGDMKQKSMASQLDNKNI